MSREAIFGKVRSALAPGPGAEARKQAAALRLSAPPRHLVPDRAKKAHDALVEDFAARLQAVAATVVRADAPEAIPGAVARVLSEAGHAPRLRMGGDSLLADLPWSGLAVDNGRAEPDDAVGLSRALAGIAETGTLVMASGADNPATLVFLPETHIAVVWEETITGSMEEAFDLVRAQFGRHEMPRTVTFVSGPSRTGDIGGRIVLGAHGPRRLIVVLVRQ